MGKLLFFTATVGGLLVVSSADPVGFLEYIGSHMAGVGVLFFALALAALVAPNLLERAARWLIVGGLVVLLLANAQLIADLVREGFQ